MNTIIQCPACSTKFALNASQLAGIESPKFHCSRCNTIFNLNKESTVSDENQVVSNQIENIPSVNTEKATESNSNIDYFSNSAEAEQNEEDLFETDITNEDSLDTDNQIEISNQIQDSSPLVQNIEDVTETWQLGSYESNESSANTFLAPNFPQESQLPLQYETTPESEKSETDTEIKIDWPIDDGSKNLEVDMSSVGTINPEPIAPKLVKEDLKVTGVYHRSEAKSLLASLLGEDEDNNKAVETTKQALVPSVTIEKPPTPVINKLPEPIADNYSEKSDFDNRSSKHTTVLKRSDVSFQPIQEEEVSSFKEMDFSPISKERFSAKNAVNLKSKLQRLSFSSFGGIIGYLLAWSIPLLLLGVLWFLSNEMHVGQTKNHKSFSRKLIKAFNLDKLPNDLLPPSDLTISKLSGQIIKLDSSRSIVVTKGNLLNMSTKDYSYIKIEARLFNRNQIQVGKEIAAAPNQLTQQNIRTLSIEQVRQIQNSYIPDKINLSQKTITPFLIALDSSTLINDLEPKFFGVRVYSVGSH